MPTSRSPFGVNIAPLPFPDFQTDINKQLSFWNTMQQMQRRAAGISGGGRALRNENGLTPYQQAQMDYKKAKDEAKAAEAEAKKNVMLGLDPVSKEPIVYRNESGQNLTQKDRDRLLADELQRRLKNAAGQDVELNKALGELNSGTELSTQRRSELQRVVRDRTKALGREYGIDDRATFDAIIGPSKQILDEQRQALRNDSFLDTVWAGMRKGGNALYYALASPWPWVSDADRLENARKMREEQDAITKSSPTLQERALVEAEAAREGKDVGYMQAAQANLASNIGASVADTVTSFAPAIAAGMIPVVGTYAAPALAGGIGAGLNQVSQAARVEADPNLTEAQKQQALSYSDPGFATATGIGAATGFLMPGSVGSGAARLAGRGAAALGAKAGSKGVGSRLVAAGERAAERANAPRSLAALSRDVPVNMAENAGLMAANTVGANMAYNASVGQPLTQGAMEGAGRAAMEGAVVGVPFGIGRTLRRRSAPRAQATTEGAAPASTPEAQQTAVETSRQLDSWRAELSKAVNAKTVDEAAANRLIAEYLDAGTPETVSSRLDELRNLPVGKGLAPRGKKVINNLIDKYWKGALDDGTIAEKIASNYQRPAEGESRLTANMGEPERAGTERPAGQGTRDDSSMEADSAKRASDAASRSAVPDNASGAETSGGGDGGSAAQNGGPTETPSAASPQAGREGTPASQQPANAGSPRPSSVEAGDGTRVVTLAPERGDGSKSNAGTTSGSEQPGGVVINWGTGTHEINGKQFVTLSDPNGNIYSGPVKAQGKNKTRQWALLKDGKRVKRPKDSPTNQELSQRYNELEAAKSTNPKGDITIREQRGFHGGADFDAFNLDFAGSGEGGSAHGWGAYAALEKTSPFSPDDTAKGSHTRGKNTAKKYRAKVPEYDTATVVLKGKRWNINEEDVVEAPDGTDPDGSTIAAVLAIHRAKGDVTQARSALEHEIQKLNKDVQELQQEIRTAPNDSFRENLSNMLYYDEIFIRENQRAYDLLKNLDTVDYKLQEHRGRLYTVEVPEFDVLLHEDLPMSKQPKKVRESVQKLLSDDSQNMFMRGGLEYALEDDVRGRDFYSKLVGYLGSKEEASYLLNHYGIEGIYAFGRNDGPIAVVFNDEAIKILLKERRFGNAPALSDKLIEKYFRTPEERAVLAALRDKTTDAATYQSAVEQFANIVMSRFPGLKRRDLVMLPYSREANATYDPVSGNIGLNPGRIWDASDSVAASLNFMTHELRGHAATNELLSPTARRDLYGTAYRGATEAQRSDAITLYGDTAISAETAGKTSRGAYIGEEIYSEFHAANGNDPFVTNGDVRRDILDFYSLTPVNATERVQAMQKILDFLATRADDNTFKEFATSAILSSKEHVDAFTGSESKLLQLQDDGAVSASMVKMIEDYRDLTKTYGVERNKETLGIYLDELLDPETALDVFKRQSVVC